MSTAKLVEPPDPALPLLLSCQAIGGDADRAGDDVRAALLPGEGGGIDASG